MNELVRKPPPYNSVIAEEFLQLFSGGMPVTKACEKLRISFMTVQAWDAENEQFRESFARAREAAGFAFAEEALKIMDEPAILTDRGNIDSAGVTLQTNRANMRKWLASKYNAKTFGDSTTLKGDKDNPLALNFAIAIDEAKERLRLFKAKQNEPAMIDVTPAQADDDYSLV